MNISSVKLGVNIDHIATLRQARKEGIPDVLAAAQVCQRAGADSITIHLREDRRHIQDDDLFVIKRNISIPLNLEMAPSEEIIQIALKAKPDYVCLVPEKRNELTTEGGLDVIGQKEKLADIVKRLKSGSIVVSMFVNPDEKQITASKEVGADCVELHTGIYALSKDKDAFDKNFATLLIAARRAKDLGLLLNAGHGLNYENVVPVAKISGMNELNIGFSIIARAVFVGLETAVREMRAKIKKAE